MGKSETGQGTLGEVRDMLGDPWAGPGRVGGSLMRSGTGRKKLVEVWDRSGDT